MLGWQFRGSRTEGSGVGKCIAQISFIEKLRMHWTLLLHVMPKKSLANMTITPYAVSQPTTSPAPRPGARSPPPRQPEPPIRPPGPGSFSSIAAAAASHSNLTTCPSRWLMYRNGPLPPKAYTAVKVLVVRATGRGRP